MAGLFSILIAASAISAFELRQIRKNGGAREATLFVALMATVCAVSIALHFQVEFPNPLAGIETACKFVLGF